MSETQTRSLLSRAYILVKQALNKHERRWEIHYQVGKVPGRRIKQGERLSDGRKEGFQNTRWPKASLKQN